MVRRLRTREERKARRERERLLEEARPRNPSIDDTYLVSFPKSGRTWFSYLITNINLEFNRLPVELTWWNVREYVFDVQKQRELPASPFALPRGRFILSHSDYNRTYQRVLYLVRDPRDALVSYYDLAVKNRVFLGTMDEFLAHDAWGIPAWNRHVRTWREHNALAFIQFFRYEDLRADPAPILERVYKLYGLTVDPEIIASAIRKSSFAVMKQHEKFYREKSFERDVDFVFVRKGKIGDFADGLTPAQIARIEEQCAEGMKAFGYEPGPRQKSAASAPSPLA